MTLKKTFLLTAVSMVVSTASAQWNTDSTEYDSFKHYRIGGYGEMLANFKDYGINRFNGTSEGNSKVRRNTISIPRMVLAGDVKFNERFWLGMEVEFEYGGSGQVYELENTENGEYEVEMEKGGEVAVEQFHLTYHLNNHFNIQAGHMVVPVGLTNSHHEPINFFGTVRPEGETTMLPSTWHETGLQVFGQGLVVPGVDKVGEPLTGTAVVKALDFLEQGRAVFNRQFELGQQAVVLSAVCTHPLEEALRVHLVEFRDVPRERIVLVVGVIGRVDQFAVVIPDVHHGGVVP